jgi:hypothetical protein
MQTAFANPPATVYDTCVAVVERFGQKFDELPINEQAVWLDATGFIYACAFGRAVAVVPLPDDCPMRRAADCAIAKLHDLGVNVMKEVHFVSQRVSSTGGH